MPFQVNCFLFFTSTIRNVSTVKRLKIILIFSFITKKPRNLSIFRNFFSDIFVQKVVDRKVDKYRCQLLQYQTLFFTLARNLHQYNKVWCYRITILLNFQGFGRISTTNIYILCDTYKVFFKRYLKCILLYMRNHIQKTETFL